MYYGKEAVWNVNSIEGMGTVITLTLPSHTVIPDNAETIPGGGNNL